MKSLVLAGVLWSGIAAADTECRTVDVDLVPTAKLQIVAWIEDSGGHYVDTAFITQATGLRGIGNRVGLMDLHSGPLFPYGKRLDVAPIWAHRHGLTFPLVLCQGCDGIVDNESFDLDDEFSFAFANSSPELYFTRPLRPDEPAWDAGTAASPVYTDKGTLSDTLVSLYPPRGDIARASTDSASTEIYREMNPFDAISQATPAGDQPYRFSWAVPPALPNGAYVLRVEVSKEFDFNATYTSSTFPTTQTSWLAYGAPYRGQPSVLYEVPFTVASTPTSARTLDYVGYGDLDGTVHAPDATITTDTPASGASRLRVALDSGGEMYRVRVSTVPEVDSVAPAAPTATTVTGAESTTAVIVFAAPGDDGATGTVSGYEIRYRVGRQLDELSFASATPYAGTLVPVAAGGTQTLVLAGLAPGTPYVVGIRAYDNCKHEGPLTVVAFETPTLDVGCGCTTTGDASGLVVFGVALFVRRRRRRRRRRSRRRRP